jgi:hypothetical protein
MEADTSAAFLSIRIPCFSNQRTNGQQILVRQVAPYASISCRVRLAAPYNLISLALGVRLDWFLTR